MKMTKNLTHIASSVEFEPAMTEEQLEAVFAQNDVAGFPAELDIAERTEEDINYRRRFREYDSAQNRDVTNAISHATITSTAYRGCVETAFEAYELVKEAQK